MTPKYEVGQRVIKERQEGRIQDVAFQTNTFRYNVKWDNGPTTNHTEEDLAPATLPPHYP
jgi:hypothetical protein